MAKKKKSPIQKKKEELWNVCRAYIKRRDNSTCQYCLIEVEGSNCHTSHVIPKSQGNALRYDDQNLKILCYHHHINWWHKNPLEAAAWFKEKFPERDKYLHENKNKIVKHRISDIQDMIDEYQDKLVGLDMKET